MATPTNNGSIIYHLPDGDRTTVTWPYIISQINDFIVGITAAITLENRSLDKIEQKIDTWLEES